MVAEVAAPVAAEVAGARPRSGRDCLDGTVSTVGGLAQSHCEHRLSLSLPLSCVCVCVWVGGWLGVGGCVGVLRG